jgi:hypothetical protein
MISNFLILLFSNIVTRYLFNLLVIFIIIRLIYYTKYKRKDYLYAYISIGSITLLFCSILPSIGLQLGFALGILAIFGILRYRSSLVSIKEMTYLFIVIAISVINSISIDIINYYEVIFSNVIVVILTFIMEKLWFIKHESIKTIIYENIDLILPEKRKELIEDIEKRTGINVNKIEIGRIDFLRDVARIRIYYNDIGNNINLADADEYYSTEDLEE